MKRFTHSDQQRIWNEEHKSPKVLLQMDAEEASGGVIRFLDFLERHSCPHQKGLEMGCGKGRNVIWLAEQGVEMYGFDFSPAAIAEAKRRAKKAKATRAHFNEQDATKIWQYESDSFDFGIDCFALTDIESEKGRERAVKEFRRVLKPGGYLFAYLLSTDDSFHKEMIKKNPAKERNAFYHTTGKFEKTFDKQEIKKLYKDFKIIDIQRVNKTTQFFGKSYPCKHFWLVLQK